MIFRHALLILGSTLLLMACQSGDSEKSPTGKSQPSATMQHLQRDKTTVQSPATGTFSASIVPTPLTSADQAGAIISNCQEDSHYQWEVNGNESFGNESKPLSNTLFQRGDSIRLIANCGAQTKEKVTVVENTPPMISAVKFQSPELVSGQDLTVIPVAEDLDGDFIDYSYEWTIDGVWAEDITEPTLPGHLLHKGTEVVLAVIPHDNFSDGVKFQGLSFSIPNAAPIIKSQPPPLSSSRYLYKVEAVDPDKDDLNYQLSQGPAGMAINEKTGALSWSIDQNTPVGNFDIEIIVADPEGLQARQFYTLSLSKLEPLN